MYSTRSHVRDHAIKVSVNEANYERMQALCRERRCQMAALAHELLMKQLDEEEAHAATVNEAEASINALLI